MIDETPQKDELNSASPPIPLKSVELGDIIQIQAPRNREIHEQIYYVFYADEHRLKLLNTSNRQLLSLAIESYVADESITGIALLSRSKERGFARQNRLLPLTWVDVHFGGEMPAVVSGEITNLEEDMIEITTYPDIRVIYIDFGYQGIPEDLPIERIVIRDKPASVKRRLRPSDAEANEISREEAEEMATIEYDNQGEFIIHIPENVMPNPSVELAIEDMIDREVDVSLDEDEDLGEILVNVEVPESERRYSVEAQVADLMGELVSKSIDDAHRLVTRFKQLRQMFSIFDANENVVQAKVTNVLHKPLVDHLTKLNTPIPWVLPVIYQKRKIRHSLADIEILTRLTGISNDLYVTKDEDEFAHRLYSDNGHDYLETMRLIADYTREVVEDTFVVGSYLDTTVQSPVECIVDTEGGFKSYVMQGKGKPEVVTTMPFVNRRLLPNDTMWVKHVKGRNRDIFVREPIANTGDIAHVKSYLFLSMSVLMHSLCQLPSTNIYVKSKLASIPLYKHRMLRELTEVQSREIVDFTKEIRYDSSGGEMFLRTPMHYYTETEKDDNTLHSMLNSVIPRTRTLIRIMEPSLKPYYSFVQIVTALEPFLVEQENITFQQYLEIRHYVKEKIKAHVMELETRRKEFGVLKNVAKSKSFINRVEQVFYGDFSVFFKNAYKTGSDQTASELMHCILSADAAELYLNMIRLEGLSYLNLPENLLESVAPDTSDPEKIKERDCTTRYIAKKYLSLAELQKESGEEVVFCDKVYDDTPYSLLAKYKDERKRFNAEEFREFFVEKLISDHECPPHLAEELADTIILGKRRVKEGDYAVLEIRPKLGQGLRIDDLSPEEKRETEKEAEYRKKTEYYRRVKNDWVRDTEVNADSFLDTNTLFCNISSQCNKIPDSAQCLPSSTAAMQMRLAQRARMVQEFDARVTQSIDELRKELETLVNFKRVFIRKNLRLKTDALYKPNDYAYQLGKFVSSTESVVESPNAPLLELILSLPDFIEKQTRILHFGEQFTRTPMQTELQEDPHWMYCVHTNVKVLPISIYSLAKAFVMDSRYVDVLDEFCRTHGTLSDDGDSIVDKYTGYVLRKIDYSAEEGFDDSGFKITSNAIVEKDLATIVQETLAKKHPVFEDPISQMIYNVFRALAENIGISNNTELEEFVLRVSTEMMNDPNIVSSEANYLEAQKAKKSEKEKAVKMPYSTYQNQTLITFVACTTLIAVQTVIPSFKAKKTFPGCVQSFDGFPMDGNIENAGGIQYMACVLHGIKKSSAQPWKSIEPLNAATLVKRMKPIIRDYIYTRSDVKKLYELKRAYLHVRPDDTDIPNTVSVNRWANFLPGLFAPNLANPPLGITVEYEKEMFHSMTKGTKDQLQYIHAIQSKMLLHAYGIQELVEHIVSKKRAILATSAGQPFLENACCNESGVVPFRYFANENENVELYARRVKKMGEVLERVAFLSKARIFFDPDSSRLTYTRLPDNIVETVIYAAYMYYGHFDDDMPIPEQYHTVIKDKPAYDRYGSLTEKIAYLKKHGKNYTLDDFYALMRIVNSRNTIHVIPDKQVSPINGFKDMLEYFDLKDSSIVEKRLRDLLWATLDQYNPKVMVYEERDTVRALNQYLLRVNKKMGDIVYEFIRKTSKLSDSTAKQIKDVIDSIDKWNVDLSVACRQISNSVYLFSKVFPSQIMNGHFCETIPKHWNFAIIHQKKIERQFIEKYYGELTPFFIQNNSENTFATYLSRVQNRIYDLSMFMEQIPRFSPIRKGEYTFYSLYPENTIMLLYKYCWYSVLHEYVVVSTDAEFKRMREEEWKKKTRENMKEQFDVIDSGEAIRQIRIVESEDMELRKQASDLLVAMLKIESGVKTTVDKSYASVMEDTMKLKYKDKLRITDYLASLNKDDRKLEQLLRSHKLGRWNVGLQKGLYQYDKNTYETEVNEELIYRVPQEQGQEMEVEDLDRIDETENEVYEAEGYDISRLDEEYDNGHYYEEDYAEDRETDF
jgi:hypothetical protein